MRRFTCQHESFCSRRRCRTWIMTEFSVGYAEPTDGIGHAGRPAVGSFRTCRSHNLGKVCGHDAVALGVRRRMAMHPHTAQTPRGPGLQRGRPPVPQFPADAALAPADEILFEEIADVIDIDRVPRKSFRSRAHSTYVERRLRGRQKSRRSIASAARSSCDCTSSPQSVGGPRAGESGGGSGGSPRCVRIFRIGTGLGVTRSAGCRRHTPGTHAETPPPPGP